MACWVVPTIAAGLLGVSLDHLMELVRTARVKSRFEGDALLVDATPPAARQSPARAQPEPAASEFAADLAPVPAPANPRRRRRVRVRPFMTPTAPPPARRDGRAVATLPTTVTDAELAALHGEGAVAPVAEMPAGAAAPETSDPTIAAPTPLPAEPPARPAWHADPPWAPPASAADDDEMGPAGDPDPDVDAAPADDGPPLHWQQVRSRVARTRKPPGTFR